MRDYLENLQVRSLPFSTASAFANEALNRACPSCNGGHRAWSNKKERNEYGPVHVSRM
jgi:hypothetical protein